MVEFHISTILIANILGILILLLLVFVNQIWLMKKNLETLLLDIMIGVTALCCVIDPITYVVDGKPGKLARLVIIAGNSWLYFSYVLLAALGALFFLEHFHLGQRRKWNLMIGLMLAVGVDLVVINLISPVIFKVGEDNRFVRIHLWEFFFGLIYLVAVIGLVMYLYLRKTTSLTNFFPHWLIVLPLLIGTGIQYHFYGIPILWPCEAITLTAIVGSLKNEQLYRDPLTGWYNRFYLSQVWRKMLSQARRHPKIRLYGLFFFMNDLRQINQVYGYREGDQLLMDLSGLFQEIMKNQGIIFRYNFESFIVFLPEEDESRVQQKKEWIDESIIAMNQQKHAPYEMEVGSRIYCFEPQQMSEEEFLEEVAEKIWK